MATAGHWQERKPTGSIGHLVPAEVEVRGVGMDHRCGAVEGANFLIVTDIWKRKQRILKFCRRSEQRAAQAQNTQEKCRCLPIVLTRSDSQL